jgi:tetratricopeptide (TPR) repeat protein
MFFKSTMSAPAPLPSNQRALADISPLFSLLLFFEKKECEVRPQMDAQLKVKQQAEEIEQYVHELQQWETDMKKLDAETTAKPKQPHEGVPPPRARITFTEDGASTSTDEAQQQQQRPPAAQKAKRISSWDYASWDRFDADAAAHMVDAEDAAEEEQQRKRKAEAEREAGNALFRKGKFFQAAEAYGRAMQLDPKNAAVPANRALCYLRLDKHN